MKRLVLLLSFALLVSVSFSQRVVTDTLQGNETVYFEAMNGASQISVLCTQLGGTSDGSLYLQASTDGTNFVNVTETAGSLAFYPNDTLTVTNTAGWLISIKDNPFSYYRIKGTGTASDTTKIVINWGKGK